MTNNYTLEIACFSITGARVAEAAGAHRIELCENPEEGGTTPSYGTLKIIQDMIKIPVFPIIRARGGDFVYSAEEKKVMLEDLRLCRELGFPGAVVGALLSDGNGDLEFIRQMRSEAIHMQLTFHRAFDRSVNPLRLMEQLIKEGYHRILSSGQYPQVMQGLGLLKKLMEEAAGSICIMPGSGLHSRNVLDIARFAPFSEFHTAARKAFHPEGVFSPSSMNETLQYTITDAMEIKAILNQLNLHFGKPS